MSEPKELTGVRADLIRDPRTFSLGRFLVSYGTAEVSHIMGVHRGIVWRWATRCMIPSLSQSIRIVAIARDLGILLTLDEVRPLAFGRPPRNENSGGGRSSVSPALPPVADAATNGGAR